ncbi:MAG: DegV family EDD domain-containing protein [Lachnospiraceae bacterium]|nr:DegV family EDD domain-containing protein [Lachnospiraceae bacterium]
MKFIRFLKSAVNAVKDPNRDFDERLYLILSFASEIIVFIAFIGDIIIKENPNEILLIGATLIFVPVMALVSLYLDKLKVTIKITAICVVFIVIPGLFFFGGGVKGGGVIWFIFAFMYIGLLLHGRWRNVMFMVLAVSAMTFYYLGYHYPWWVYRHSERMFLYDSIISLILVGALCFIMNWSYGRLFTEENDRAKKEAKRAEDLTRAQNRFFSSMSHEIRTPINSILGLNELILRDQNATDDIVKDASGIQGSGKMLLALINDILDFSKIEAGSMDIVTVDYKVGDMLSEVVNMIWLPAHDKGLGFEVNVDPAVPSALYGDEVRIKQVVINLLNNAVKYTQSGHIELRVDSDEVDRDTVELSISVSDTGMGIKREDLPFLFDAFKRLDEGKNRHIEGTGLGLSIVKQLVDLMGGTISVNSVYGEGSTFTFTIKQPVTDHRMIGDLNIHSQHMGVRNNYESGFLAPEANILIVDDNEMNLEVESRLLIDTDMGIDKAQSGKEALEMCLKTHYDAILMDHLMPVMDGIECLRRIRTQSGGLNRNTPIIVLTANAGSENRELYNQSGFDGYLVKPVSGEAMEEALVRHISSDKVIRRKIMTGDNELIRTADKYAEKVPVIITSSSMCDLPDAIIRKLNIPIIPFEIKTDKGVFKDGIHMDANELIRHINAGKEATSSPPDENEFTEFFADVLKRTHHIIHIAITSGMSVEFKKASEAAGSFGNVTVINSECISSASGLLVLIANKLVQQGLPVEDIISELEEIKHRLKCSFVINTTEYMTRRGLISPRLHRVASVLNLHPMLRVRKDRPGIGGIWPGTTRRAYRMYISRAFPADTVPDPDVVFVTYVDVPNDTLAWIEEQIRREAYFEHIVFQQASAAVSSNCGPGTFGIMYVLKSNKSYNIASYFRDMMDAARAVDEYVPDEPYVYEPETDETTQPGEDMLSDPVDPPEEKWYQGIKCIDTETALKNCGSEEAFATVLKIFHDSVGTMHNDLEECYRTEDWKNYTIKIHALKSSARLIGASELGEDAQLLETAGKEGDISYIRDHHTAVMNEYLKIGEELTYLYKDDHDGNADNSEKPMADASIIRDMNEGIRMAAGAMDCNMLEDIMNEIDRYSLPVEEKEKFDIIRQKAAAFDYDGIMEILGSEG